MNNVKAWAPMALIAAAVVVVLGLALATMTVGGNATPGWLAVLLLIGVAVWFARRPRRPLPPSIQEHLGAELAERGVHHAVAGEVATEVSETLETSVALEQTSEESHVTSTRRVKMALLGPTLALCVAIAGTVLVSVLNNTTYGLYALALCVAYGLRDVAPLLVRFYYWAGSLVSRIAQSFGKGNKGRTILWLKFAGTSIIVVVLTVLAKDFLFRGVVHVLSGKV
jgi:hypothetical protein